MADSYYRVKHTSFKVKLNNALNSIVLLLGRQSTRNGFIILRVWFSCFGLFALVASYRG